MKTNKLLISLVATLIAVTLIATPALAGSKQQHRWEGVAIGVGAAILGHAIYHAHKGASHPQVVYQAPEPAPRYHHRYPFKHRRGHWEWKKTWVAPTYEKIWNPGHYNRRGRWIPGHWIDVQTSDGYWKKERVWVAHNHRYDD